MTLPTSNLGQRLQYDWQGEIALAKNWTLIGGFENKNDQLHTAPTYARNANTAEYLQLLTRREASAPFPAFGFFGNPNLKPEESTGYDIGFEQPLFDNLIRFGATYYQNFIIEIGEGARMHRQRGAIASASRLGCPRVRGQGR